MKPYVAICLPFSRYVPPEWALSLAAMAPPMNSSYTYIAVKNMPRDQARNTLVERALDRGAKYILFLDDDTAPPHFALEKLLYTLENADEDVGANGGIYCTKTAQPAPVVLQAEGGGPFWHWRAGSIFECAAIGAGCLLIRSEVFGKIGKPWFCDVKTFKQALDLGLVEPDSLWQQFQMTDDVWFCRQLRQVGYRILAHGGVLPIHWDEFGHHFELPEDSYPVRNALPGYSSTIIGWMTDVEIDWLRKMASEMTSIVEVGSWAGRSTHAMATANPMAMVTAVDHWQGSAGEKYFENHPDEPEEAYRDFLENTRTLANVSHIRAPSIEAAREFPDASLDCIFIDGGHSYEEVLQDIQTWMPKARKMLCGHDYDPVHWPGVVKAVDEMFGNALERHGTIWVKRLAG